jgi:two-component system OmpR family sensor kinase
MRRLLNGHLGRTLRSKLALFESATQRYGTILLTCSLPVIMGLGAAALLPPNVRSDVLIYQENLARFSFWGGFLGGVLCSLTIGGVWVIKRQAERARHQAQQAAAAAKQRLLRNLDHELKTPLTTIGLSVESLQLVTGLPAEQKTSLDSIAQQVRRLQSLIKGLRHLTEQEESMLEKTSVDLAHVLQEAMEIAKSVPAYRGRSITLDVRQFPWPLPPVWGDHDCLVVVFRNLLENALKFSAEADRVQVRAWQEGHTAVVEIADIGSGILPEDLPYIFEELFRGNNARHTPGSGLGLASAHRLVALHGGTIGVDSRLGQGTVMTIRLPQNLKR